MPETSPIGAHIAFELVHDPDPKIVVIEFLSRAITDPRHARELGEELRSLIQPGWPLQFVIDFKNVRSLGSTAFGEIASFAHDIRLAGGQVSVCRIAEMVRLGASLIGLDDEAHITESRQSAINAHLNLAEGPLHADRDVYAR
jgi:anti-anti-sigma regulatory factor